MKNNDTCALSELANKMKLCSYTLQSLGYEADVNDTNNLLKMCVTLMPSGGVLRIMYSVKMYPPHCITTPALPRKVAIMIDRELEP